MPVTRTITLYKFDELSEKAQQKALDNLRDINVDYNWWEYIYEDAANIGLTITEFDLGYSKIIKGELKEYIIDSCRMIRHNHGKDCDTFKTAKEYLKEYIEAFIKWKEENKDDEDCTHWKPKDWLIEFKYSDEAEEVTKDFKNALLQDYYSMLDKEYDYRISDEQVKESIEANEYLFHDNGTLA
jgi:hypothetical protein